jgi:hypothetical protein
MSSSRESSALRSLVFEEGARGLATGMPGPRSPAVEESEEDEMILPPLDDDDEDDGPLDVGDLLSSLDEEGADPFDDATASELETGLDVGLDDDGERGGDEAAEDGIDVGALDDELMAGGEVDVYGGIDERPETGLGDDDEIGGDDERKDDDDGGAEGTAESGEDDVNEADLPELDADEGGDYDAEDVVAEMTFAADTSLPPWDAQRFTVVEGAGAAVPCSSLAIAPGKVAAAGEGEVALLVDEEARAARRAGFEAGARAIAITEDGAIVAAAREKLWISRDGGETAAALAGWRGNAGAAELATTPGRIWILSEGALWSMASSGGPAAEVRGEGVLRIAATGTVLAALTRSPAGPSIERLRGDDEGWQATPLEGEARRVAEAEGVTLAAAGGGRLLAVASPETVAVSRDGGASFEASALPGVTALCFAGDAEGAPLLAVLAPPFDDAIYVALVPASGPPTRIAEVAGSSGAEDAGEDDRASSGPAAIGWDSSREVAWVACRAGLFALARAQRH